MNAIGGSGQFMFDPDLMGQLAGKLTQVPATAGGISQALDGVQARAEAAMQAGGVPPPRRDTTAEQALLPPSTEAGGMASDIRSRQQRVLALNRAQWKQMTGVEPDLALALSDNSNPDPAKVKAALAYFRSHINDSSGWTGGDSSYLQGIDNQLQGLTPAELNAFERALTPAEMREWDKKISSTDNVLWYHDGLSNSDRAALASMLLKGADPATITKIEQNMPCLQPDIYSGETKGMNMYWLHFNGTLFGPDGMPHPEKDVVQGDTGDCWFLASLAAVARKDPAFIKNHIWQNANGTYTVRLYQNGKPVDVTVTGDLPAGQQGYAGTPGNVGWVAIYEKAFAQLNGGYGNIEGGYGNTGMADITGQQTSHQSWGGPEFWTSSPSLTDIQARLKQGDAVTAGTTDDKFLWWGGNTLDNNKIVADHEYYVKSVNTSTQPPTITLVNPWGSGGVEDGHVMPQYVTLTQDQFKSYFNEVDTLPQGGW